MERVDVLVIGGGSAGLAVSHELTTHAVEHLVLERERIGQAWRDRWDSFCLVTPSWSIRLPGGEYTGDDPDGFLPRDAVVAHLQGYAGSFGAPVREGVSVLSVERAPSGFVVRTSEGDVAARSVVVCTGAFRRGHRPPQAQGLPTSLLQLDLEAYRSEAALPPGRVLIVGSGQSGCQLAEELHEAGRDVVLSCGRAPWAPRRWEGRDLVWWSDVSGFLDQTVESLSSPAMRLAANVLATGHSGGHDLNLRTLRSLGVTLVGHLEGTTEHEAVFAPDLGTSVAWGDARYRELMSLFVDTTERLGLPRPEVPEPAPFDDGAPRQVSLDGFGSVIFAGGFRPDYRSLLAWDEAFDDLDFPLQKDGASLVVDGLYFAGVHFMRARKSSTLIGVGEDATLVAGSIAARLARA